MVKLDGINRHTRSLGFIAVLMITGYFSFLVIRPYLGVLFIAWLYAILVYPLYRFLQDRFTWKKSIITLVAVVISLVLVVLPLGVVVVVAVSQLGQLIGNVTFVLPELSVGYVVEEVNEVTKRVPLVDISLSPTEIQNYILQIVDWVVRNIVSLVRGVSSYSVALITDVVLLFIVLFALLPNFEALGNFLKVLSPLSKPATTLFMSRSRVMLVDTVKATVVIALIQALLSGVVFWILGVPYTLVWSLLILLTALIPVIGAAIVTVPMAIIYLITGNWLMGIVVLLWQILVISNIDNMVRSKMVSEEARVPGVVMLVAVLGGLKAFGFLGIFYGPLAVGLFLAALEVYLEEYKTGV